MAHRSTLKSRPASIEANVDSPPISPSTSGFQLATSASGDNPESHPGHPIPARTPSTPLHNLPPVSSPTVSSPPSTPSSSSYKVHKHTRSTGPSALEKVISRTRPTFLPPKKREEDDKHLSDWEDMMRRSRAAGAQ